MSNELARLDEATRMLAEIKTLDEAKDLIDLAEAARVYAREVKLGLEAQNHAAEIKLRAQRRGGEILRKMEISRDGHKPSIIDTMSMIDNKHTLAELGIGSQDSSRWQQIARIPETHFEKKIARTKESKQELTTAMMLREARIILQQEAARSRQETVVHNTPDEVLLCGDFYELSAQIPDDSVDLIFTDPPYDADHIELYAALSEVALRVLRPGGLCLAYSGQVHLPEAIMALEEHLSYLWIACIRHSEGELRFRNLHIHNGWKPLILCGKAPIDPWWDWFSDTCSGGKEKDRHPWQQAIAEAAHFIAALSPPGGLVLDPLCGSGTTLLACKKLGRRYLGIDIDPEAIRVCQERLNDQT